MEMIGLKEIRKKKKLSQLKVAFDLNISREAISYYENGKRSPSIEMLLTFSEYYNVSIDYLVGRIQQDFYYSQDKKRFIESIQQSLEELKKMI